MPFNTTPDTILIVGAGPSGLVLATELNRLGIPFNIIDKAEGPAPLHESRALAFNTRSQQILAQSGVTSRVRESGHLVERVQFRWKGQLRNTISIGPDAQNLGEMILCRQGDIERQLISSLAVQGVRVHWNTRLISYRDHNGVVSADLVYANHKTENVSARYIVGCDGAHSAVRKQGGYTFDGETDPQGWSLADIRVADNRFSHTLMADLAPGRAYATMPINHNVVRLIHNGPDLMQRHPQAKLATDVIWQSDFTVSYRMVKQFSRGLSFLCGDAAHIHSPVGGRGMNLGIEDAATLAWLLYRETEYEYSGQRHPIAQKILKLTHGQTSQMNSASMVSSFIKQFGPKILSLPPVYIKLMHSLLGLDTPAPVWLDAK